VRRYSAALDRCAKFALRWTRWVRQRRCRERAVMCWRTMNQMTSWALCRCAAAEQSSPGMAKSWSWRTYFAHTWGQDYLGLPDGYANCRGSSTKRKRRRAPFLVLAVARQAEPAVAPCRVGGQLCDYFDAR